MPGLVFSGWLFVFTYCAVVLSIIGLLWEVCIVFKFSVFPFGMDPGYNAFYVIFSMYLLSRSVVFVYILSAWAGCGVSMYMYWVCCEMIIIIIGVALSLSRVVCMWS